MLQHLLLLHPLQRFIITCRTGLAQKHSFGLRLLLLELLCGDRIRLGLSLFGKRWQLLKSLVGGASFTGHGIALLRHCVLHADVFDAVLVYRDLDCRRLRGILFQDLPFLDFDRVLLAGERIFRARLLILAKSACRILRLLAVQLSGPRPGLG